MSKKKVGIFLGTVLLIAAAAGGVWYYTENVMRDSNDRVYVEKVSSIIGTDAGVWNRYSGVVKPQKTVEINADAERTVAEVLVKVGDKVSEGDVLFKYDTEEIELELEQAKLEVESIDMEISSFKEQIAELEKEKKEAPETEQFDYTTEIQTLEMQVKQTEYNKTSKELEVEKLEDKIEKSEVTSTTDGTIKSINDSEGYDEMGNSSAFISILTKGDYKIQGSVNEQNMGMIYQDAEVIVRSRVDENMTWTGVIDSIDTEATLEDENSGYGYYEEDEMTSSSNYAFYVALDDAEGLMLGQHVLVELDEGQLNVKEGIWLYSGYIVREDAAGNVIETVQEITPDETAELSETEEIENEGTETEIETETAEGTPGEITYVWADDGNGRLEKRMVELGAYDAGADTYEILSGLTEEDKIAWPMEGLYEGIITVTSMDEVDYTSDLYTQNGMTTPDVDMYDGMMTPDMGMYEDMVTPDMGAMIEEDVDLEYVLDTEVSE